MMIDVINGVVCQIGYEHAHVLRMFFLIERNVFVYRDKSGAIVELDADHPNITNTIVDNSTFVSER